MLKCMQEKRSEGVVLRAIPYQEKQHIVRAFTPDRGLISLFVRSSTSILVTPLTRATFVYREKPNKDLFPVKEAALLDAHINLRHDYDRLSAACAMARALLATQEADKAAPQLYQLFLHYLSATSSHPNIDALAASFHLKLLKYEGLSTYNSHCDACHTPLKTAHLLGPSAHCPQHAPPNSISFDQDERSILLKLSAAQTITEVTQNPIETTLRNKIEELFNSLLD